MRILLTYFAVLCTLGAVSQETLTVLKYNESIRQQRAQAPTEYAQRDIERKPFVYLIDTLELPFIDDFSKNKVKRYEATKNGDNITLKVLYDFSVNNEQPPRLEIMHEPTYSKVKKTNGDIENEENPTLFIVTYDSVGNAIGNDTGWTNIITIFDQSQGIVSFDTLKPDKVYINTFDTLYLVSDDNSIWITPGNEPNRGGAYINNQFSNNPITQGIATFDGTDALGTPYDIGGPGTYGSADTLESKPIALDPEDQNVFLTFFYQAGGLGNMPDEEDSLVLEFFDVASETWRHAWSVQGDAPDREWSEQVWVKIEDPRYLLPGFQFRFRNYATLSAAFDHWNIDYVRLDADRDSIAEDTINDVSLMRPISSFTAPFTAVPYEHYLAEYEKYQSDTVSTLVKNLGPDSVNIQSVGYEIFNQSGASVSSFFDGDPNLPSFVSRTYNYLLDGEQEFPTYTDETHVFDITTRITVAGLNDLTNNDTIYSEQVFANHYAYDDGTAEAAYGLTGAGVSLAMGFVTHFPDSIRAIHFNFPQTIEDNATDLKFEILIWENFEDPPIYEAEYSSTPKTTLANEFERYILERPVAVNGEYYIGIRQLQAEKIYIGFDMNQVNNSRLYYQVGSSWLPSTFPGSLMMRPDFGNDYTMDINEVANRPTDAFAVQLYPNPAEAFIQLTSEEKIAACRIYNMHGQRVLEPIATDGRLQVGSLTPGAYVLVITNASGDQVSKPFIKR